MALRKFRGAWSRTGYVPDTVLEEWAGAAHRAMVEALHWSDEFERSKAYLEETPEFQKAVDSVRRKMYGENWDMGDAASKYNFQREKANMLHAAILAQRALRKTWIDAQGKDD